jgi:three-Cys-motif partner protein
MAEFREGPASCDVRQPDFAAHDADFEREGCAPVGKDMRDHGGTATGVKAQDVAEYLAFYSRALKKRFCEAGYFDAFGQGGWADTGTPQAVPGAALRILEAPDPVAYYAFSDLDAQNAQALSEAVETFRATRLRQNLPAPNVKVATQDGNLAIRDACAWMQRSRIRHAVIFLDAFGMQVEWQGLEAIARSGRLDMWLLVPAAPALGRATGSGDIPDAWRLRFDRLLGDPGGSERLSAQLRARPGKPHPLRGAMDLVERSVIDRLKSIFPPRAVRPAGVWLACGGHPSSLLVFACANSNTRSHALALKAADYLVSRVLRP